MMQLIESPPGTNIPGMVRKCADPNCRDYIPCPHIRCQKHRKDFAIDNWVVPSYCEDKVIKHG